VSRNSARDKAEAAKDKTKGRAREAAGSVSGDESSKAKGRKDQDKGTAKEKKGKLKDLTS
jgi:uncharacterized protein YjbJ (UPF0337 family)